MHPFGWVEFYQFSDPNHVISVLAIDARSRMGMFHEVSDDSDENPRPIEPAKHSEVRRRELENVALVRSHSFKCSPDCERSPCLKTPNEIENLISRRNIIWIQSVGRANIALHPFNERRNSKQRSFLKLPPTKSDLDRHQFAPAAELSKRCHLSQQNGSCKVNGS